MIIQWNLEPSFETASKSEKFLHIVGELLRSSRLGHHLLVLNRGLIARLLDFDLGQLNRAHLQRLSHEFTQTGRLYEVATALIRVTTDDIDEPVLSGSALVVPISKISEMGILEKTALLVENADNDGWLYGEIIALAARNAGRGHVSIDVVHGGGTTTPDVLINLISDRRVICTIADADKDCPSSQKCDTLKKLEKRNEKSKWLLSRVFAPPCRELENVIPLEIVIQVNSALGNDTNSIALDIQEKEISTGVNSSDHFWSYFDIKRGMSSETINDLDVDSAKWLKSKISTVLDSASGWKMPGFGDAVISQIRENDALTAELRRHFSTKFWRDKFWGFFSFLAWFFVSTPRRIT